MNAYWRVLNFNIADLTPLPVAGGFVRNAWGEDFPYMPWSDFGTCCPTPGDVNSVAGLSTDGISIYSVLRSSYLQHSNLTSSENYVYFIRDSGAGITSGNPVANSLQACRVNINTSVLETVNILPSWSPPSGSGFKDMWSAIVLYTEDIGYAVVSTQQSGEAIQSYLIKIDFSSLTYSTVYTFTADFGFLSSDLFLWQIETGNKWILTYPHLTYEWIEASSIYALSSVSWLLFDPATDTAITTISHSYASYDGTATAGDNKSFFTDGNGEFSNPTIIGDKLTVFMSEWLLGNILEVHCLDLNSYSIVTTRIERGTQNIIEEYGAQVDVTEQKVYCKIWYYTVTDTKAELLCYDPATDTLTSRMLADNQDDYAYASHRGVLADSQRTYTLEVTSATDQQLRTCSDNSLVVVYPIKDTACSNLSENLDGMLAGNLGTTLFYDYFTDLSSEAFSFSITSFLTENIFLHLNKIFVFLRKSGTPAYFYIYLFRGT